MTQSSFSSLVDLTNMEDGRRRTTFSARDVGGLGSLDMGGRRLLLVEVPRLRKHERDELRKLFSGDGTGAAD